MGYKLNTPSLESMNSIFSRHGRWIGVILALSLISLVLLLTTPARTHLRALGLLLRVQNPQHPGWIAQLEGYPIQESLTEVPTPSGRIRARLYVPEGIAQAPGMVMVHGVHDLGIEEPRLVALARAVSASGIRVLTPELRSLADYRVESASIDLIGYSARYLSESLGQKVGVLGISFAGGLSLLAASEPQYEQYMRFVLSVGSHDDLERVSRFFINNRIVRPDGSTLQMAAHEYGVLVLIYSHVEDFFPAVDVSTAHEALKLLLWEQVDESRKQAALLSPPSRQKMDLLYDHHVDTFVGEMEQSVARHRGEMALVSPHGRLQSLHVPTLLLHGAADNVIPPSELLWLQQDVPHEVLQAALSSPAISHASMEDASVADNLRLVHFMARVLKLEGDTQRLSGR